MEVANSDTIYVAALSRGRRPEAVTTACVVLGPSLIDSSHASATLSSSRSRPNWLAVGADTEVERLETDIGSA